MQVSDIKYHVNSLLAEIQERTPNIIAAHLLGSINDYRDGEPFPDYLDVDIAIVQENMERDPATSLPYPGLLRDNEIYSRNGSLLFECVYFSDKAYVPEERLLADPSLVHVLFQGERIILQDPRGFLADAVSKVKEKAFLPDHVRQRCEDQAEYARGALKQARDYDIPAAKLLSLGWVGVYISGMIAEALKQTPTHRRALVNLSRFCSSYGRDDLYRQLLSVLGYDRVNANIIDALTGRFSRIIDRAIEVKRTPVPYSFKVVPGIQSYMIEGTQEISREGYPREAAFWAISGLLVTGAVLLTDAPDEEKPEYMQDLVNLFSMLGMDGNEHWNERLDEAERLVGEFRNFACELLET